MGTVIIEPKTTKKVKATYFTILENAKTKNLEEEILEVLVQQIIPKEHV
jgi:hypothetical protein